MGHRLRAWAKANHVPVVYCTAGERKHEIAEEHLSTKQVKPGLFLVLVSKAPALVWEAQKTGTGKLGQLAPKDPWPYFYCVTKNKRMLECFCGCAISGASPTRETPRGIFGVAGARCGAC